MATEIDADFDDTGDDLQDHYDVELGGEDGAAEELSVDDPVSIVKCGIPTDLFVSHATSAVESFNPCKLQLRMHC